MTGLTHSYQQLKLVDRAYQQCLARKPAGFWLTDESQENSWSAYLDVAGKGNRPYHRRDFEIDLFDVRVIRTEDQMCGFNLEYATVSVSRMNQTRICSQPLVDWPRVAQSYKGVIITPYQRTVMEQDAFRWFWCRQPTGIGDNGLWRIRKLNGILYLPDVGSMTTSFSSAFAGIFASN